MRLAKSFGFLILLLAVYLFGVIKLGTEETWLKCNGALIYGSPEQSRAENQRLIVKVESYRFIIFWAEDDGMLTLRDAINGNYNFEQRGENLCLSSFSGSPSGKYFLVSDDIIIEGKFLSYIGACRPYEPSITM